MQNADIRMLDISGIRNISCNGYIPVSYDKGRKQNYAKVVKSNVKKKEIASTLDKPCISLLNKTSNIVYRITSTSTSQSTSDDSNCYKNITLNNVKVNHGGVNFHKPVKANEQLARNLENVSNARCASSLSVNNCVKRDESKPSTCNYIELGKNDQIKRSVNLNGSSTSLKKFSPTNLLTKENVNVLKRKPVNKRKLPSSIVTNECGMKYFDITNCQNSSGFPSTIQIHNNQHNIVVGNHAVTDSKILSIDEIINLNAGINDDDNSCTINNVKLSENKKSTAKKEVKKQKERRTKINTDLNKNDTYGTKIFLRAKCNTTIPCKSKWQMDSGTRHEALQRIDENLKKLKKRHKDLFPLDVEVSDSDTDLEIEESGVFQKIWLDNLTRAEYNREERSERISKLYNELRRKVCQVKESRKLYPSVSDNLVKSVIDAARTCPSDAALLLFPHQEVKKDKSIKMNQRQQIKSKCGLKDCENVALPFAKYCTRHILNSDSQVLFERCSIRGQNNSQCANPVVNVRHHYPVCSVHAKSDIVFPDFLHGELKMNGEVERNHMDLLISNQTVPLAKQSSTVKCKKRTNNVTKLTNRKYYFNLDNKASEESSNVIQDNAADNFCDSILTNIPERNGVNNSCIVVTDEYRNVSNSPVMENINSLDVNYVNSFEITDCVSSLQDDVQYVNSVSSLPSDILIGSQDLTDYIQIEDVIEEVEITDEVLTLDSSELASEELAQHEDIATALKHIPAEAFNELFSDDKNESRWKETEELERALEEVDKDVQSMTCSQGILDPSILFEEIGSSVYSDFTNSFSNVTLPSSNHYI